MQRPMWQRMLVAHVAGLLAGAIALSLMVTGMLLGLSFVTGDWFWESNGIFDFIVGFLAITAAPFAIVPISSSVGFFVAGVVVGVLMDEDAVLHAAAFGTTASAIGLIFLLVQCSRQVYDIPPAVFAVAAGPAIAGCVGGGLVGRWLGQWTAERRQRRGRAT